VRAADRAIPQYVDGVLERPAPEIPAPIQIRMNRPDEIFPRNVSCARSEKFTDDMTKRFSQSLQEGEVAAAADQELKSQMEGNPVQSKK
jgi:hypothetical protein